MPKIYLTKILSHILITFTKLEINMKRSFIIESVRNIVKLLITEDFKDLWLDDLDQRIVPEEIAEAVSGYGKMTIPPASSFDEIRVFPTDDPNVVRIDFDLWFDFMKSDLTLRCTIYMLEQKKYSIDDIRVL